MAHIVSETFTVTISRLVGGRTNATAAKPVVPENFLENLELLVSEVVGDVTAVVEVFQETTGDTE